MITHVSYNYISFDELDSLLCSGELMDVVAVSSSVLVQIFSSSTGPEHILGIVECIAARLPAAVIAGATTVGEIHAGLLLTGSTVIGITCFASSSVTVIGLACDEEPAQQVGAELGRQIGGCTGPVAGPVAGVLLLATSLSIDAAALLGGIESVGGRRPARGAGRHPRWRPVHSRRRCRSGAARSVCAQGSFGVAAFAPGDSAETLVSRADVALYAAKNAGRNRIEKVG